LAASAVAAAACSTSSTPIPSVELSNGAGGGSSSSASAAVVTSSGSIGSGASSVSSASGHPCDVDCPTSSSSSGGIPIICGQPDVSLNADPPCDLCITEHCCTEYLALPPDADATAYFACVLGPMLDGTGGCYASNDPTTDLAGFQACWNACIDANAEGAHASDAFNLCASANGCFDADLTCVANFLFSQGACDSGYTFIAAECDECMGERCCAGIGTCLFDDTCKMDFDTCAQDGTRPECATDAAAGALATCGRDNCAMQCGFAPGAGGSGGAGGSDGAGGIGGHGGAGGHGGGS
jgi:hypothetical protein